MAALIVRHRVANFENWKHEFDAMEGARREHGWLGHTVYRDAADPNLVTVVNRVRDVDSAKRYGSSPDLKAAMEKAGVISAPDITFLEDAEEKKY